jgi:peroxiredoxin
LPATLPSIDDMTDARLAPGDLAPDFTLTDQDGAPLTLSSLRGSKVVLYFYPEAMTPGCTTEACDFRDHHSDLVAAGVEAVHGISAQDTGYQREVVERLGLPFSMLADPDLTLAAALALPTFTAGAQRLYRRLTVIVRDRRIEHVFYPVFPPGEHAREVLAWLRGEAGPAIPRRNA